MGRGSEAVGSGSVGFDNGRAFDSIGSMIPLRGIHIFSGLEVPAAHGHFID